MKINKRCDFVEIKKVHFIPACLYEVTIDQAIYVLNNFKYNENRIKVWRQIDYNIDSLP